MINWTPIVTFPFNVWKQTTPVELRNRKIEEIVVGASHWQLSIVLLDSGIMGMIGKLLLELEYSTQIIEQMPKLSLKNPFHWSDDAHFKIFRDQIFSPKDKMSFWDF